MDPWPRVHLDYTFPTLLSPRSRTLTFDFPATPSHTPGAHPSSHHTATPFIAPLLVPPRARPARTHSPRLHHAAPPFLHAVLPLSPRPPSALCSVPRSASRAAQSGRNASYARGAPSPRHGVFGNTLSARSPLRRIPASSRTLSATCSPRRVRTQLETHRPRPFRHRLNLPAHPPHRSPLPIAPFPRRVPLVESVLNWEPTARAHFDTVSTSSRIRPTVPHSLSHPFGLPLHLRR
ncbi:hypothetical protein B0H19DRAFT_722021 [Mycena capillaripes]|nr:hypothetical protein B0H19DRAFT_722021 [Mycena capillaripes]